MTATSTPAPAVPPSPAAPAAGPDEAFALPPPPAPHPLRQRRYWLPLVLLLALLNVPFLHYALRGAAEVTTTVPFKDDFERPELGRDYGATGGFWRILGGQLYSPGVKNNPLWLKAKLPRDVVVEFDARADSTSGDIKCEIFGNGRDHSSGYVLVFGGWTNTISALARLDEHGADRKERRDKKVEKGKTYHFKITREGRVLTWFIDGESFLSWDDAAPLEGSGHDRFGFGTWATDAWFDNLEIRPL
jgi:hypothetical protein